MKALKFALLCTLALCFLFSCSANKITQPKNVIIIIGDGAGFNQMLAGSLYLYGAENSLVAQQFPVKLACSTFSTDGHGYDPQQPLLDFDYLPKKPTDSAAGATALATGIKTYNAAIGVDTLQHPLTNIFQMAERRGKATGVVTSVPLSHATPAGFVAHHESRGNYHAIAEEMILESAADVIIGCGHPYFNEDSQPLLEPDFHYISQAVWEAVQAGNAGADADSDGVADPWTCIESRQDFQKYAHGEAPKRLLGIPQVASTLQVNRSGADGQTEPFSPPLTAALPTLAEMSQAAINVLDADADGFYLMIEAGAIDWACHANNGARAIEEVIGLEETVQAVVNWVETNSSWNETLVIVTADHETGYLTGPGSGLVKAEDGTEKVAYQPLVNNGKGVMPGLEFHSGGHTNSLVPFLARGAFADGYVALAVNNDPIRGAFLDNTDIPKYLMTFLQKEAR